MSVETGGKFSEAEDAELMRLSAEGRAGAFACLVRRHQQPLMNFFCRMGAHTDSEDMVQETLVRVYKYRARYRPSAKFTTFLYTVARHVWLDGLRKAKRADALSERMTEDAAVSDDGGLRAAEARIDVQAALATLPEAMRSVVVMAVFQHMRYEEIAEVLGIPAGTVKSRIWQRSFCAGMTPCDSRPARPPAGGAAAS
jgi:RNA polymerase sigma-70 factor (ECF subfamily)